MTKKKESIKKEISDEDVEKVLDATWENWESRRNCEQKHIPEFFKRKNKND